LQFFNLFSNSYEFWTIDCSLNSFRNGKRLDRTMGHIFQQPNPVVGCTAQLHNSGTRHCAACSRSWLAHGHAGPVLVLTYTTLGGTARLASAQAARGRGVAHQWQWLEPRASEEGAVVACFDGGRGWCGFGGDVAWLGRHSSGGAAVSRDGRTAAVKQPSCAGGSEQRKGRHRTWVQSCRGGGTARSDRRLQRGFGQGGLGPGRADVG
jgi:hypothetical protein